MSNENKKERRWLKSVIAASAEPLPNFPWMRGNRSKPEAIRSLQTRETPAVHATPRRITLAAR